MRSEIAASQRAQTEKFTAIQTFMAQQVEDLRRAVHEEAQAREQADNEMVSALKQYTLALHDTLLTKDREDEEDPRE